MKIKNSITFKPTNKYRGHPGTEIFEVYFQYKDDTPIVYMGGIVINDHSIKEKNKQYLFIPKATAVYLTVSDMQKISKKLKELIKNHVNSEFYKKKTTQK